MIGFWLAGMNMIGVTALIIGLFLYFVFGAFYTFYVYEQYSIETNSYVNMIIQYTVSVSLIFIPHILTMLGSIGYAGYIALN